MTYGHELRTHHGPGIAVVLSMTVLPTLFHKSLMKELLLALSLYRRGNRHLRKLNNILKVKESGKAGPSLNPWQSDVIAYGLSHSSVRWF